MIHIKIAITFIFYFICVISSGVLIEKIKQALRRCKK